MKVEKSEFKAIEHDLRTIRLTKGALWPLRRTADRDAWNDPIGRASLRWIHPGALAIAGACIQVHKLPRVDYLLQIRAEGSGLLNLYEINSFDRHRSFYKTVMDGNVPLDVAFNMDMEAQGMANALGLNDVMVEDVQLVRGVIARRAEAYRSGQAG